MVAEEALARGGRTPHPPQNAKPLRVSQNSGVCGAPMHHHRRIPRVTMEKIVFMLGIRFRAGREAPMGGAFFLFSRAQLPHPNHVGIAIAPTR